MPLFKTRPVVIVAQQWVYDNVDTCLEFLESGNARYTYQHYRLQPLLTIDTLEGTMTVSNGDYIIKGSNGEFYPCKPNIFHMKYERMEND